VTAVTWNVYWAVSLNGQAVYPVLVFNWAVVG